jgi:pantetheine-phosphate adenylyltransferase
MEPWTAVYPGTFDPFTPGHADIATRALRIFDRLVILIAVNAGKTPASIAAERAAAIRAALPDERAEVDVWEGLTATYCTRRGIPVIVRGVRNAADRTQEYALAAMNQTLGVQTLLLPARPELAPVSSSVLRAGSGHRGT